MKKFLTTLLFFATCHIACAQYAVVSGACSNSNYPNTGRSRVAWVGDSYELHASRALGSAVATTQNFTSPEIDHAAVAMLDFLAGWPWYFDNELDNGGVNGATSLTDLSNMPQILNRHPQIVFIGGPHNDAISGLALATTESDIETMTQMVQKCGAIPVLIIDPSINSNESSTYVTLSQLRKEVIQYNNFERWWAADQGILTWDWYSPTIDPTTGTGSVITTDTDDSIHPNFAGNFAIGQQGLIDLKSILGSPNNISLETSAWDGYDATYNIFGNLLAAPIFSSSTASSGCVTGVVPTSWSYACAGFTNGSGNSVVGSLVTSTDGIANWAQVVISGTSTGGATTAGFDLQQNITANIAAGEYLEGWVQVNVLANSPFSDFLAKIKCGANTSIAMNNAITDVSTNPGPNVSYSYSGTIWIPPVIVPTAQTSCFFYLETHWNASANNFVGTIQFRRPAMRIVQNPY